MHASTQTEAMQKGNQMKMKKPDAPYTTETHQSSRNKKTIMATALMFSKYIHANLTYIGMIS